MTDQNSIASHSESPTLLFANSAQRDFFRGAVLGARSLGFEHSAYLIGVPGRGVGWRFVMTSNFPRPWQERYLKHGYHAIDPTIEHAKTSVLPLIWSSALFDQALARDARELGFNHGWTQPLRASNGKFGALTLARSQGAISADELEAKLPMMQWLAQVVHARLFREFLARQRNESSTRLSERELEVLRLASEGGTAGDIAELTGVGERTVNFHIANIISKLGATNKTHAVTLAMRLGLLD
ncbi:LuxR family transcriptional regulator [Sulfuritalea sp.]|mgnify:CR=1 FL=1|uniref:helix-turn-helix transcriptional regulator n=1 Tax=Sulfuritalea sp. TaxID=2480090 RepID=UPI00286E6E42|nr:LuxR family transcriptional regulator [Sulfuritalea sp.]